MGSWGIMKPLDAAKEEGALMRWKCQTKDSKNPSCDGHDGLACIERKDKQQIVEYTLVQKGRVLAIFREDRTRHVGVIRRQRGWQTMFRGIIRKPKN